MDDERIERVERVALIHPASPSLTHTNRQTDFSHATAVGVAVAIILLMMFALGQHLDGLSVMCFGR